MTEIKGQMPHHEFERRGDIIRGSEFLAQISLPPNIGGNPVSVPQGGTLFTMPLNPLYSDGLRVARELSLYDQFRVKRFVVEYVPLCPSTQPGGIIGVVIPNASQNTSLLGGQLATRDALSRPGSAIISAFKNAAIRENFQQQKWYYVNDDDDANLSIPGMLQIMNALDYSSSGTAATPLGLLWLHYEFQVRSEAYTEPPPLRFNAPSSSIAMNSAATAHSPVTISSATFGVAFKDQGVVGWFNIAAIDLGTLADPLFFAWENPVTGVVTQLAPGMTIFFRYRAQSDLYLLYPSFGDAMDDAAEDDRAFQWSAGVASTASRGIKAWTFGGCDLGRPL